MIRIEIGVQEFRPRIRLTGESVFHADPGLPAILPCRSQQSRRREKKPELLNRVFPCCREHATYDFSSLRSYSVHNPQRAHRGRSLISPGVSGFDVPVPSYGYPHHPYLLLLTSLHLSTAGCAGTSEQWIHDSSGVYSVGKHRYRGPDPGISTHLAGGLPEPSHPDRCQSSRERREPSR